jgi:maleylacetate reductase
VTEARQKLLSEALGDARLETADLVAELIDELEMPNRLHQVGVQRSDFARVAKNALLDRWTHSNPRRFRSELEIVALLESVA